MLHFGKSNPRQDLHRECLDHGECCTAEGLGVQIHSSLKVPSQTDGMVKKAFDMLALISQEKVI